VSVDGCFAFERLAPFGSFFTLRTDGVDGSSGWRPVSACLDDTPRGRQVLGRLVDRVGTRLSGPEVPLPRAKRWIAASVLQLGWAARLTSLYIGSSALGAAAPDLAATALSYRELGHGGIEFGVASPTPVDASMAWRRLYDDHLALLASAIRRQVRVGQRLLDGNIASALAGSIGSLARQRCAPLEILVTQPWSCPTPMAKLGSWRATPVGLSFRRTTCCGYEQLPQGSPCGDCGLRKHASANQSFDPDRSTNNL
jgi:hypothetical protein